MECRDKIPAIPDIPTGTDATLSPIYNQNTVSNVSSESDLNIQTTTGEDEDEYRNENIISRRSSKRRNNKRRLRWRSFYTAHQVKHERAGPRIRVCISSTFSVLRPTYFTST